MKFKQIRAEILMLLVAMAWGAAFPSTKEILHDFSPLSLLSVRFLLSGLLVLLIFPRSVFRLTKVDIKKALILGALLSIAFILLITGLQQTEASKAGFIVATTVLWVPIFEFLLFKKPVTRLTLLIIVLSMAGVYMLTATKANGIELGDVLVLLGTMVYAVIIIMVDYFSPMKNPSIVSIQLLMTGICAGVVGLLMHDFVLPTEITRSIILNMAFLVVLATAFTVWAQTKFQQDTTPIRASFLFLFEPIFSMIFAYLLLHEVMDLEQAMGALAIMVCVIAFLKWGGCR